VPAKFELKRSTNGKFRFNLVSSNGQVVASSELYESKQAAQRGIASVRKIAAGAEVDDLTIEAAATQAAAKKAGARKATAKRSAAKRFTAKKAAAKKTTAKRSSGKKSAAKKTAAKKR